MRKFLLISGIVLVVVILIIWVRRTYIEHKIDKGIEAYGIPKSEITKAEFGYNLKFGYYRKVIWTKQDGEDKYYLFEYRHRTGNQWSKKVMLTFIVYGNWWFYYKSEVDRQEFHEFLEKNNWSLYYYPAPNPEADVFFE